MIRVQLLGQFLISACERELALPTIKSRMLAAYIFFKHGQWVRRDLLRGMFWGDMSEERASANLRQAIYFLKKALRETGIERDIIETRRDDSVRINAPDLCMVDVQVFESKAMEGLKADKNDIKALVAAASIYQGGFLEGVDEDWCLAERRRFSDLYIQVLKELIERMNTTGLYYAAISHAHAWIKVDPLSEDAYQSLMRLYIATGQTARAMQQYEICKKVLKEELGVNPGEDTVRLCQETGMMAPDNGAIKRSGKNGEKANQGRTKHRIIKKLSDNPLRNAGFLLVYGEDKALQGDIAAGIEALEKALAIYERQGTDEDVARTRLTMASAFLYTPLDPRPDEALTYIKPALSYYQRANQPATLCRALYIAADAGWQYGHNKEAYSLAEEGLDIAMALNDKNSIARFSLILGIVNINEFRLEEAWQHMENASQEMTCFTETADVLKTVLFYGVLASMASDLSVAERYFRETIAMIDLLPPVPKTKFTEVGAHMMLMLVLYFQDKIEEIERLNPLPSLGEYFPMYLAYLISLYLPAEDFKATMKSAEIWFRANLSNIPPYYAPGTVRQLSLQLLEAGLVKESAKWAAIGVRLTRGKGFSRFDAVFYGLRAVALAKQGRTKPAVRCRNRAEKLADETDRWTPGMIAWADGLIAKTNGDNGVAEDYFSRSINQFDQISYRHHMRLVEEDMKDLSLSLSLSDIQ